VGETKERIPFKAWFNAELVAELAARLHEAEPDFARDVFVRLAVGGLEDLEMTGRTKQIADAMHAALPGPIERGLGALARSLTAPLTDADDITTHGYRFWPYSEFIARYGVPSVDASFHAMLELTQRFSSEFAVRPFLAADLAGTLARLTKLVNHPNLHVRRWVSEGTRTRLPWGMGVPGLKDALPSRLTLLAALRHDPELYVRRSVANHLGDILKDDIEAGLDILRAWQADQHPHVDWIIRHAARTQLKAGHPGALALFGQGAVPVAKVTFSATPDRLRVGQTAALAVSFEFKQEGSASLRIDYALTSPGKSGRPSRKVFRWADRQAEVGDLVSLQTIHAFIPRSIRAVYPGTHLFEVVVNGVSIASQSVVIAP